jgi:hypothetical protein
MYGIVQGSLPFRKGAEKEAEMSIVWLRRGFEVLALVAALLLLISLVEA